MLIYLLVVFFSVLVGYQIIVKNREGLEGCDAINDHDDLITIKEQLKKYKPLVEKPDGEPTMILSRIAKLENEVKGLIQQSKDQFAAETLNNNLNAQEKQNKEKEQQENERDIENRRQLANIGNE